jgi:hypothetical protein
MSQFLTSREFLLDRPCNQGDVAVFFTFIDEIEFAVQPLLYSDDSIDILILSSTNEAFLWIEIVKKSI